MDRFILVLLLSVLFITTWAADITKTEIQDQQNAQELCIQQRVNQCINACEKSKGNNCTQTCEANAKNECRQAGE
ncbi:hypothetical protein B6N58_06125 [Legionella micdadei]|nr:hypothetical protein [Legionella micdadei]ARG98861.1 hypothetical protein B6N58_06125 [Legionella micdadei]ARH01603.1 hypothetical protein B6V88_08305 [Legionella micdadei]NSL16777.1 hypothetical protein [Legionella micdadei]